MTAKKSAAKRYATKNPAAKKPAVKRAKAEPVEMVVVLDRSGSMSVVAEATIGAFNNFIAEQKLVKGEANLTLVLFDDQYEVPIKRQKLADVQPLTSATYIPRAWTALNDAIGKATAELELLGPKKAIVCIVTDGFENASKEYTAAQIKARIEHCEKVLGWRFVYLAANQDAFAVGATYGIQAQNAANFSATASGVRSMGVSLSTSNTSYRSS